MQSNQQPGSRAVEWNMRRVSAIAVVGFASCGLSGCGGGGGAGGPSSGGPVVRPAADKIVFQSNRTQSNPDGDFEIFIMNGDGSAQTRLTDNDSNDVEPSFSFNGRRIVFQSSRDRTPEIYVMNADGTAPRRLTNNEFDDAQPSFSPDGRFIVFKSTRRGTTDIYIMNANGTGEKQLTNTQAFDTDPTFTPDGRIVFSSNPVTNSGRRQQIFVMNADGSGLKQLTQEAASDQYAPTVSPNGRQIAFTSNRDGNFEIYTIDSGGTGLKRLTNSRENENDPVWSPDGRRILFSRANDIYVMNADGTSPTRLTTDPNIDRLPSVH